MNTHTDKTQENKSQSVSNVESQQQIGGESTFQFVDNRPEAVAQQKLQEMANNSPRSNKAAQLQAIADNHSAKQEWPIQKKVNNTGLPDNLKTGMENLSGMSLEDVKVHRNSDKPAQLQAHAYAQGADIHLGPGQEKHLPHEAWHVVQQKQGRVKPTIQMKGGVNVNDDAGLEKEADVMGQKAHSILSARNNNDKLKQDNPATSITQLSHTMKIVQMEGDAPSPQQEQLLMAAEPEEPRDRVTDYTAERRFAVQGENIILEHATLIASTLDTLQSEISRLPIRGDSAFRAINRLENKVATIKDGIENAVKEGVTAAEKIISADDSLIEQKILRHGTSIGLANELLQDFANELIVQYNKAAHIAVESGGTDTAVVIIGEADRLHAEFSLRRFHIAVDEGDAVRGRKRDVASTVLDYSDAINNTGGVAAGIGSLAEVFGVTGASGGALVGALGGTLGILFGAIGTVLAIYGLITGRMRKEQLNKIAPAVQDEEMTEILEYAKTQTDKANGRAVINIITGSAAIASGTLGLVALSISTLGAAAAIAGIAAALTGLGIVAYKAIHKRNKRKAERIGHATAMVDEILTDGQHKTEIALQILQFNLNPEDAQRSPQSKEKLITALSDKVGDLVKSKRQQTAEQILDNLINGTPSQQFESEILLKALGRKPNKVRTGIQKNDAATEVSRVMGLLASW